jgi:L-threonylcarbamoyladenylate synthase
MRDQCALSGEASTEAGAAHRPTERLRADAAGVARAAALLGSGRLVGIPTETVYGLAADGRNAEAVAALYAAKGRPRFNPLIAHLGRPEDALRVGRFDAAAQALAAAFWPGPLTLVVPLAAPDAVCDLARAGLDTVALRVPSHPVASAILQACGFPVVAPSANRSGRLSPTAAGHVLADLDGRIDAVLDGGTTEIGLESTIVACLGAAPVLLRPGGVPRDALERVIGGPLAEPRAEPGAPISPGLLLSHYAPRAGVRLGATSICAGEAALLFGVAQPVGLGRATAMLNLSPAGDLAEAATNLFGHLRRLDESGAAAIAVVPIPEFGLGEAVNDRLRRAAADR